MSTIFSRTSRGMSTYVSVVISPATTTRPVVIRVSQATRPAGSCARTASSTESEIWSAILSGCPSVTDSEVKRKSRSLMMASTLAEDPAGGGRYGRPPPPAPSSADRRDDGAGARVARVRVVAGYRPDDDDVRGRA